MKKVLVITYYWPPSGGSGVQRWLKFAKYLPQYGWEPVIYTPLNPEPNSTDEGLLKDVSPDLKVVKRKILEPYSFYKLLTGKDKGKPIKANIISNGKNSSITHKLSLFVRGNFFIPDPRCLWIGPSVRYLKKYLKENPVDAIVSTGPPHSMHLIAQRVSKATGTPWLADFRDPWTEIFFFKHLNLSNWAYNRHRKLEQGVIDSANKVVVVSNKMQRDFACRTSTPVEVITNGFDPDDFLPAVIDKQKHNTADIQDLQRRKALNIEHHSGRFTLVHTGLLVDSGNPDMLWRVLGVKAAKDSQFKNNLQIITMGQTDASIIKDIEDNSLKENFTDMGYVAHNVATLWQQSASLLLLPLRKEPEAAAILTGKFFEYLASGRPILAFGPTDGDLAVALKESKSGTICNWDEKEAIREAIDTAYNRFLEEKDNPNPDRNRVNLSGEALKYSRKELTGKLADLLDNIIKTDK